MLAPLSCSTVQNQDCSSLSYSRSSGHLYKTKVTVLAYPTIYSRVEWFLKNKFGNIASCSKLFWDPKSKILLKICCFIRTSQGLRKSLKSLKNTKVSQQKLYLTFLKVLPEIPLKNCVHYFSGQKPCSPFWKNLKKS